MTYRKYFFTHLLFYLGVLIPTVIRAIIAHGILSRAIFIAFALFTLMGIIILLKDGWDYLHGWIN